MKKLIISAICVLAALSSYGQGQVDFTNFATPPGMPVIDAPVFDIDGTTRLDGGAFLAQLYAGPAGGTLAAIGTPTPFLSGAGAGYFGGGSLAIPGVAAGTTADLQVRAWDASGGSTFADAVNAGVSTGMSDLLTGITTGGSGSPPSAPSPLTGLTSFSLTGGNVVVPEPSTIALGLLGAGLLVFRRRK
jgi:hypothetical protein